MTKVQDKHSPKPGLQTPQLVILYNDRKLLPQRGEDCALQSNNKAVCSLKATTTPLSKLMNWLVKYFKSPKVVLSLVIVQILVTP